MKIAFTRQTETQRVYRPEELAHDLDGMKVTVWENQYAEELLRKFFPVQSLAIVDFELQ
jgi:methyl coenzyme M reductase subunit C-like uncharacterized protein (methanogenesis marker protein 7)